MATSKSATARSPAECALHDPAAWQEHEAAFSLGEFDQTQFDAVLFHGLGGGFACIALINLRHFDAFRRCFLRSGSDGRDYTAILLAGCSHVQGQQIAQRVDRNVDLGTLPAFIPVVAGPPAALGRGLQGAAIDHRGGRVRPLSASAIRSSARRSCAMLSKQPALNQRIAC